MREHVLPVTGAELESPQGTNELRREAVDVGVEAGLLTGLLDHGLDFGLRLLEHLLDASRMDAAVDDELLQCDARNLPADAVEAAQDHRLRRVVDDEVDAGHALEGTDVAALAADDAALHVVARQSDDRYGGLGHMVGGGALDGERQDVAGAAVRLAARLLLERAHHLGHIVTDLRLGLVQQHLACLGDGQSGDTFQQGSLFRLHRLELVLSRGDLRLAVPE